MHAASWKWQWSWLLGTSFWRGVSVDGANLVLAHMN